MMARELYVFELELKEYSYSTFESLKQFVNLDSLLADEVLTISLTKLNILF